MPAYTIQIAFVEGGAGLQLDWLTLSNVTAAGESTWGEIKSFYRK